MCQSSIKHNLTTLGSVEKVITPLWQSFCLETSTSVVASYCKGLLPTIAILTCLHLTHSQLIKGLKCEPK